MVHVTVPPLSAGHQNTPGLAVAHAAPGIGVARACTGLVVKNCDFEQVVRMMGF